MNKIYLTKFSVQGIKTLEKLITISFYKKTIDKELNTQDYNVKGIYGMNGTGKSGIITAVNIMKKILINPKYLSNNVAQQNLKEIINKKLNKLFMEVEYIIKLNDKLTHYKYTVTLSEDIMGNYVISKENLAFKKAISRTAVMKTLFESKDGKLVSLSSGNEGEVFEYFKKETMNLLSTRSMSSIFVEKLLKNSEKFRDDSGELLIGLIGLFIFGSRITVYLEDSDDHRDYIVHNYLTALEELEEKEEKREILLNEYFAMDNMILNKIEAGENTVPKDYIKNFISNVDHLKKFLQIFKPDLKDIVVEKKHYHELYICTLTMVYESYEINSEFESTGIKKLIKLFTYLNEMVHGGIVFIDEMDANLHDVYLCALLEYLMEYGEGQLCFTTHNVGPMNVLRKNKKSIDFLSEDHNIYPWVTSGNYSPSKLYRNGMIEGSPFNIDSIDFIGIFNFDEGDD